MIPLSISTRVAAKIRGIALHEIEVIRRRIIYDRYRDATMIPRGAYLDNLAIAARAACNPSLANYSVVECGTWRGGMSAGLMEILGPGRAYHFFDSFSGLPPARDIDGGAALAWQANTTSETYFNNCSASEEEFRATIARVRGATNFRIYKGLFEDTVAMSDTGPIAVLRVDGDWYESTMSCLSALFPRLVGGSVLIIDDYGTWDGCTRALHDYLAANKRPEPIERFGASGVPYLRVRSSERLL